MSDKEYLTERRLDLVTGIASKVRQDAYAAYQKTGKQKYRLVGEPVTPEIVVGHLTGAQPIACYAVFDDQTYTAVLDFDDHDKTLSWDAMVGAAQPIIQELQRLGFKPLCCRSGGGAGLHIWLIWSDPQPAKLVKQFLRKLIEEQGFKHGGGGVQAAEIEVFPKNDHVKEGSYGNAVALPYSRKSVPLDEALQPLDWPDFMPPDLEDLLCPDVASVYTPQRSSTPAPSLIRAQKTAYAVGGDVLPGDEEEVKAALKFVEADDYETWVIFSLALKYSFGDEAFDIWDVWSSTSAKYEGSAVCREVWDSLNPNGDVTIGTIFHAAKQRGWNGPSNAVVRDMNARFGIWTHGSSTRIIVKQPVGGEVLTCLGKGAFLDRLKPEKFPERDANGNVSWRYKAPYWLDHHLAAHYHEVAFDPGKPPGHNGNSWNMWQGFPVEPKPGDWSRLQHHILVNICGGNEEYNAWMMNWMALGVQRPDVVIGTAPVLKGAPGTGKGVLANAYGHLWGAHYVSITKDDHVSGRFNQHLEARRLVYVDEAMFGGDRKNAGVIKTMLTEPRIMIERKGVDPVWLDNHMIFIVTSNEKSVVPADIGDRRWQVIEVADTHREDRTYFGSIAAQMRSGGYEAMMHDLLQRDISVGPDPQVTIRTPELFDQIIQAQGPTERYLYEVLDAGYLPQPDAPGNGPGITTISAMYDDMKRSQPSAQYTLQTLFGRTISKVFSGVAKVQSGNFIIGRDAMGQLITKRSMRYRFPPLHQCRRSFEVYIGQEIPWSNEVSEWQGDIDPGYDYSPTKDGDPEPPF
ncbi:Primase C terminal 2 (PriCT-2) [Roseovarius marisflavi]|uniref:Primase C terminal 2 (PriCT-2) n=1 Tax=Roseovarius marisflavi TaxID=1054996 RepID=A0A1M7CM57_9RHOB|nr:DUF5906 domain-containing protein [Roseovarius marisflavi]SHL68336.1 Primase C terminal 2 (PriCT-2) [Roseovarius marisflavi]